jgi:D-beta-D-heptose 7-phosphate kinase / D-beta-D-heptose 1-phosphate adenosyltransferase
VLADYGKGVLDAEMARAVLDAAAAAGVPAFVDPKTKDFSRYRGATCITPNLAELSLASGMPVGDEAQVAAAARHVLAQAGAQAILATRSEKGMMLVEASGEVHSVPARAREVFDVSGAGDTVIATLALCHAAGRPLAQAMHVANAAAGVVVSKLGTATADIAEVMAELDAGDHELHHDIYPGAEPLAAVKARIAEWKEQGLSVGFANGCFDIIHPGHVALLEQARAACDRLVVALNTDASVQRLKGPARPINPLESRARVMAALKPVDCVTAFDQDTPLELICALMPDVLVKGSDYSIDKVVGADVVQAAGGRVVLADLVAGQSTTGTVARIRAAEGKS